MTESFEFWLVLIRETFDFGMFMFTAGTAGLHNFSCVKIFNGINFLIKSNSLTRSLTS